MLHDTNHIGIACVIICAPEQSLFPSFVFLCHETSANAYFNRPIQERCQIRQRLVWSVQETWQDALVTRCLQSFPFSWCEQFVCISRRASCSFSASYSSFFGWLYIDRGCRGGRWLLGGGDKPRKDYPLLGCCRRLRATTSDGLKTCLPALIIARLLFFYLITSYSTTIA